MMFVPLFTVDVTQGLSSWLAVLLGAWIMMLALVALGYPGARRPRIASVGLGVALAISPWLFGYADSGAAADSAAAVGLLVSLVSISGRLQLRHTRARLEAQAQRLTPEGRVVPPVAEARELHDAVRAPEPPAEIAEELATWIVPNEPSDAGEVDLVRSAEHAEPSLRTFRNPSVTVPMHRRRPARHDAGYRGDRREES
jgi:hypothetical protein